MFNGMFKVPFRIHSRHRNRIKSLLLCGTCFLTFFFLASNETTGQELHKPARYRLIFCNVENLFDTKNDSCKNDDAFTPSGDNHWTQRRYRQKLTNICRVLAAAGEQGDGHVEMPIAVGLAEVENDRVLHDLCRGTALRRFSYMYVHYESPDKRGIDNALLYRPDCFTPFFTQAVNVSDSTIDLSTRDILLVEGKTRDGDTLILLINHFPSKLGGATADSKRDHVAQKLQYVMDTLFRCHPHAAIVVMGDFNASPDEPEIARTLMQNGKSDFVNLMSRMERGTGSHNYQGKWSYLDQILVPAAMLCGRCSLQVNEGAARLFAPDFMLVDDERHLVRKPFRTYLAMKYQGGFSDHLPVYIDLVRQRKEKP